MLRKSKNILWILHNISTYKIPKLPHRWTICFLYLQIYRHGGGHIAKTQQILTDNDCSAYSRPEKTIFIKLFLSISTNVDFYCTKKICPGLLIYIYACPSGRFSAVFYLHKVRILTMSEIRIIYLTHGIKRTKTSAIQPKSPCIWSGTERAKKKTPVKQLKCRL